MITALVLCTVAAIAGNYWATRAARDYAHPVPPVDAELAERVISAPVTYRGVPRNNACPCGSGKKFKRCHAL